MTISPTVAVLNHELRLTVRARVPVALAGLSGIWVVVILALPSGMRSAATGIALLVDIAGLGLLYVPAVVTTENATGTSTALMLTSDPPARRLAARIAAVAGLSVTAALVVVLLTGVGSIPARTAGVLATSTLFTLLAHTMVGSATSFTVFMERLPLVAVPLVAPALASLAFPETGLLRLSPATDQIRLMMGHPVGVTAWAWQALWLALAAAAVLKRRSVSSGGHAVVTARSAANLPRSGARALLWLDRRSVMRDRLAAMILVGIPLTAGAVRLMGTAGAAWLEERHGISIEAHLPALWAALIVIHTPLIVGSLFGLFIVEDRASGLAEATAVTRLGASGLARHRLVSSIWVSTVLTLVGLWLGGVQHPLGVAGLVGTTFAAAGLAVVPTLVVGGFARDRAQAVTAMKLLTLPLYLPVALWYLSDSWMVGMALVPSTWATLATWTTSPWSLAALCLAGAAVPAAITWALWHRFRAA